MKKKYAEFALLAVALLVSSACHSDNVRPAIVPGVEVKAPVQEVKPKTPKKHSLGIIGGVEPIYILPMKSPFSARIDTGAETSSLDVENREFFERDGEKWVAFDVVNRESGESHHFEKKIHRQLAVKRIEGNEGRVAVLMSVKFGGEIIKTQFTLATRDKFSYQGLIGRNIITGRAIVDPSVSNTLK